jgi:hypothetical protein
MGNAVRLSFALLLLVVLPACSSNRAKTPDAAATMTPPAATSEPGVVATPLDPEGVVGAGMAAEPNEGVVDLPPELVDRRVIYFSYDSDTLGPTEIELVADVAGAPPSQLLLVNAALQTSPYKHYIAMVAAAMNAAYGDQKADLTQVLTPEGLDFLKNMDTMCSSDLGKAAAGLDFTKLQKTDPATIPSWNQLLKDNDPGPFTAPIPVPLLIIHGGNDEQIPVVSSALLFDQLCKIGQVEQRWVFAGQSHAGVIAPSFTSMMTWIGNRFAGKPMPDPIAPTGAVVQSCPSS